MDNIFWILHYLIGFIFLVNSTTGQSDVKVQLLTRKYVEKGSNLIMRCVHNIDPNILYKVAWLKNDANVGKFFEFIADRTPPFRNFSIPGAEIDWLNSNSEQVALKNIDFDAAGLYYCEVTTSTPIYTKPSQDEQIHVFLPQTGPPRIFFIKRRYYVGDKFIANCTTSKARPPPHITWLINGKKVDDKYVRQLHLYSGSGKSTHRSKSHQQQQQQHHHQQHQTGQNNGSVNKLDSRNNLMDIPTFRKEENIYDSNFHHTHDNHHHSESNIYSPLSQATNSHESNNHKNYDNKYFDTRKHRNSFNRKYRRYINEGGTNIGSSGSSISSYGGGNVNGSGTAVRFHRGMVSSSQLNIEISEHHIGSNGKLEITCLATTPAHVSIGEEFADYKTYSVKVDVERPELPPSSSSSSMPPMSGMAALGNASSFGISIHGSPIIIISTLFFLLSKF